MLSHFNVYCTATLNMDFTHCISMCLCVLCRFSCVQHFVTLWTIAHQAPLSMGFSNNSTRVRCHFLLHGIFQDIEPAFLMSPALAGAFLTTTTPWEAPCMSISSVQFSSVAQLCPTLCNPMNHSTPGLPIHHQLPEFTQTHVRVGNAIQPSHSLSSLSPPAPNPSQR